MRFKQAKGFENILSHQNSQFKSLSKTFPFLKVKKNFKVITSVKKFLRLDYFFKISVYFSFSLFVPLFAFWKDLFILSAQADKQRGQLLIQAAVLQIVLKSY